MSVLLDILREMHDDIDFETHTTLIDDKVIDSFDIITLIAEIDDRIGITIPADELIPENFNSYTAINALLSRLEDEDKFEK
ncbi:MAG: acyl carrier protein [Oscillospiraceae bacterium]|jgi:acyl carrier protein|nr:acyl carrier protein [Oscillospiraceae bacterium]